MIKYKVLILRQSRLNYFSKEAHNLKIQTEKNKDLKADWTLVSVIKIHFTYRKYLLLFTYLSLRFMEINNIRLKNIKHTFINLCFQMQILGNKAHDVQI